MADIIKNLAQVSPDAVTLTTLLAPIGQAAVISSVVICNTNAAEQTFRLSHAIGGAADDLAQYLYYDIPLAANDTFVLTIGMTLAAGDGLRCQASAAGIVFNVYGVIP